MQPPPSFLLAPQPVRNELSQTVMNWLAPLIKLSQLYQIISNSGTSWVEKSKLSFQSLAVIAASAIGKVPPVLSVCEYLIGRFHPNNCETILSGQRKALLNKFFIWTSKREFGAQRVWRFCIKICQASKCVSVKKDKYEACLFHDHGDLLADPNPERLL